jgi:hypothetical protein
MWQGLRAFQSSEATLIFWLSFQTLGKPSPRVPSGCPLPILGSLHDSFFRTLTPWSLPLPFPLSRLRGSLSHSAREGESRGV